MNDPRFNERLFAALLPFIMQIAPVGMGWHAVRSTDPSQPPLLVDENEKAICTATRETIDLAQRVKNWEGDGVSASQIETLITVICRRLDHGGYPHRWRYRDGNVISCNDEVIAVGLLLKDAEQLIQEALRVWSDILQLEAPQPTYNELIFSAILPVVTRRFPAGGDRWRTYPNPVGASATIVHRLSPNGRVVRLAELPAAEAAELVERVSNKWREGISDSLINCLIEILLDCLEGTEEYRGHPSRWQYHPDDRMLVVSADNMRVAEDLPQEFLGDFMRQATEAYHRQYGYDEHTGLTFDPPKVQAIETYIAGLPGAELIPTLFPAYAPDVQLALQLLVSFIKLRRDLVALDLTIYHGGGEGPAVARRAFTHEYSHSSFMGAFEFLGRTGWVVVDHEIATALLTSRALQRLQHFGAMYATQRLYGTQPPLVTGYGSCTK